MVATAGLRRLPGHLGGKILCAVIRKEPVAVNCWVVPAASCGLVGVTSMRDQEGRVTLSWVVPVIGPASGGAVALMMIGPPGATPVLAPDCPPHC